jgi:hypothetical protein
MHGTQSSIYKARTHELSIKNHVNSLLEPRNIELKSAGQGMSKSIPRMSGVSFRVLQQMHQMEIWQTWRWARVCRAEQGWRGAPASCH